MFNVCFTYFLVDVSNLRIDVDAFDISVDESHVFKVLTISLRISSCSEFAKSVDVIAHFLHAFFSTFDNFLRSEIYFLYLLLTNGSGSVAISLPLNLIL